jgi:hypothetical protein
MWNSLVGLNTSSIYVRTLDVVTGEQGLEFAIGRVEAHIKPLNIRVYRPVLPKLAGAVGCMNFSGLPAKDYLGSCRVHSPTDLLQPDRPGAVLCPDRPEIRKRIRSDAASHALRLWITSVI